MLEGPMKIHSLHDQLKAVIASGLGAGIVNILMQSIGTIQASAGAANVPSPGCHGTSYVLAAAFADCMFVLLNILWMILGYIGFKKGSVKYFLYAGGSHLLSVLTAGAIITDILVQLAS
ncbi:hypothetical protein SARC_09309 [Sphaeroforma arctica JP610]|uniref:Uncharacterized protein n=1 Tax=Sphaeroforma arctica JP610 TaxID=667725 RepID=A0A0L0FP35_9EUKA|nr:hypothetical protein SARC_09309 [Sphaeroforma arctica JP610]KNC78251.1 hypothetical protein SARC_09309 [Sphaeroforma arctica JP610]|eukprot:XP_014152153.1 hypothetical protein SARC_09309 [Sphaeroforma arctica JP610]